MTSTPEEDEAARSESRDGLWKAAFETYYDSYYEEIVAHDLINRWQFIDDASKCVVALTVSGSAVSGWALWTQPGVRWLWALVAGMGAVLAILQAALGVAARITEWGGVRQLFAAVRVDMETFRYRMEIDADFSVDQFAREFVDYRKRYADGVPRLKNDLLLTRRLKENAQNRLNERLKEQVVAQE